jgi:pimeloyl-ACP methyl ester carboxylesterase
MTAAPFAISLPDGRRLHAQSEGDPDGVLLVLHHGSPGAAVPFPTFDRAAAERGVRLVTYSRPGFGGSSRREGRRVVDCAADVAALVDHLGAERFLTVGWSGGGPHALACAARLPERVMAAATIAGVAPYDAEGLDWTAGMGEDNQVEYPLAAIDPEAHLIWMRPFAEELAKVTPEAVVATLRTVISDVDEAWLAGELGDVTASSFREAFRDRLWGWRDDDLAFVAPWGFDPSDIRVPVTIWQGDHDLMVPPAHGRWLLEHIPTARSGLRPEHGHLSLAIGAVGEILDDLLEAGGVASPRTSRLD